MSSSFTMSVSSGDADLEVQFTDTTPGGVNTWLWDFGDGATSTLQNPTHTFTTAGTNVVTLIATRV
jgi:PKD repeat protein